MAGDRKTNRSQQYQSLFCEISFSNEMMVDFADSQGMTANNFYSEELLDLKEQLKAEFWRLVETELTPRQAEVVKLYAQNWTQQEIAKKLGINQSSITKAIRGNCDYKNGKRMYGGANKKLRKLAETDPKIQEILRKIAELEADRD